MSARTKNYSEEEIKLLLSLVRENVEILENKSADKVKPYQKEKTWTEIEQKFNMVCPGQKRSAQTLRTKYANMKGEMRKRAAEQKRSEPGGGPPVKKGKIYNSIDETLKEILYSKQGSRSSQYDSNDVSDDDFSDALLAQNYSHMADDEISEGKNIESDEESDDESSCESEMWNTYTPQLLKIEKPKKQSVAGAKTKTQTNCAKLAETEIKMRRKLEISKKEHEERIAQMQKMHELNKKYLFEKHEIEMRILRQEANQSTRTFEGKIKPVPSDPLETTCHVVEVKSEPIDSNEIETIAEADDEDENVTEEPETATPPHNAFEQQKSQSYYEALENFTKEWKDSQHTLIQTMEQQDQKYLRTFEAQCERQAAMLREDRQEMEKILKRDREEMKSFFVSMLQTMGVPAPSLKTPNEK